MNLLSAEYWQTIGVTVAFPDFTKGNAYAFSQVEIDAPGLGGGTFYDRAVITTILPQEWSAGQVIGAVPSGCNYIDVRASMVRTKAPSGYIDMTRAGFAGGDVPNMVPAQQSLLRGGSCLCELTAIWRRLFEVVLSGNQIVLNRFQSVWSGSNGITWASGNNPQIRGAWTYDGPPGAQNGHLAFFERSGRVSYSTPQPWRGGSNGLSVADTSDYSATWSGSLLIRPGYLAAS